MCAVNDAVQDRVPDCVVRDNFMHEAVVTARAAHRDPAAERTNSMGLSAAEWGEALA